MTALPPGYTLTGDRAKFDPVAAHGYLTRSYWSPGIPLETVERAIAHSICVAVLKDGRQVAFARVISDRATMAYLADVYVLEDHRGIGLSHRMLEWLDALPELQSLRRWVLFTQDAQALYAAHGWSIYPHAERLMIRDDPDVYR